MTESQDCYILLVQTEHGLMPVTADGTMKTWKTLVGAKGALKAFGSLGKFIILNIDDDLNGRGASR
jgi:hypothetical protein